MSDNPLPDWPMAEYFHATPAHLHAFGAITLDYNEIERAFGSLFKSLTPLDGNIGEAIYSRLTNKERADVMRLVTLRYAADQDLADAINHAILCFNICTENRNILMHLVHDRIDEQLNIHASKKSSAHKDAFYEISLTKVRQIAEDMHATLTYVVDLLMFVVRRLGDPDGENLDFLGPNTLPKRPAQPSTLIPLQLPKGD